MAIWELKKNSLRHTHMLWELQLILQAPSRSNHKVIFRNIGGLRLIAIGVSHMAICSTTPNAPVQVEGAHAVELHHTSPLVQGIPAEVRLWTFFRIRPLHLKKQTLDKLMMRPRSLHSSC